VMTAFFAGRTRGIDGGRPARSIDFDLIVVPLGGSVSLERRMKFAVNPAGTGGHYSADTLKKENPSSVRSEAVSGCSNHEQ